MWTNWHDFLMVDTSKYIKNKDDWIMLCKNNNVKSINEYNNLCNSYDILPKIPNEFYKGFTNIARNYILKQTQIFNYSFVTCLTLGLGTFRITTTSSSFDSNGASTSAIS